MAFDFESFTRELAEETSMDDLPSRVSLLMPPSLDADSFRRVVAAARTKGGGDDAIRAALRDLRQAA